MEMLAMRQWRPKKVLRAAPAMAQRCVAPLPINDSNRINAPMLNGF